MTPTMEALITNVDRVARDWNLPAPGLDFEDFGAVGAAARVIRAELSIRLRDELDIASKQAATVAHRVVLRGLLEVHGASVDEIGSKSTLERDAALIRRLEAPR